MDEAAGTSGPADNTTLDPEAVYAVYSEQHALETESGPGADGDDIATKARLYLAKKREELSTEIQARFADVLTTYEAVKGYNDRSLVACQLAVTDEVKPALNLGSFFNGDGRMANCRMRVNFAEKAAFSYSFCPDTLRCCCCSSEHKVFAGARDGEASRRIAVLLCDQAGPPCLASTDPSLNCIPVIRKESGLLLELAEDFLERTKRVSIVPGSICIISSATQLAMGDISDYIKDLVTANGWFQRSFKGEMELVPGPIFVLNGSNSTQLHHSMSVLQSWCKAAGSPADLLHLAMGAAISVCEESKVGPGTPHTPQTWRLPSDIFGEGEQRFYNYSSNDAVPVATGMLSTTQERRILAAMKTELNSKRGLAIGDLVADRTLSEAAARAADRRRKYLVIGASNSERLSRAMEEKGAKVAKVVTRNWKAADETVAVVAEHIKGGVESVEPEVVVFELLDNLVFLGRRVDGTTELPKRSANGIYHISGELIVASKEVQYNLYKVIRPLLMAVGNRPLVVVTPFPRYISAPCCGEPSHVTNFRDADFAENIIGQLGELRMNFRSFLFSDRLRRTSTIDPAPLMEMATDPVHWVDPVHPKPETFAKLADLVLENADRLLGKRKLEEEANMVRSARGGWSGAHGSTANREWRGPASRRGAYQQRGNPGRGRGGYVRGQQGGYRRESY